MSEGKHDCLGGWSQSLGWVRIAGELAKHDQTSSSIGRALSLLSLRDQQIQVMDLVDVNGLWVSEAGDYIIIKWVHQFPTLDQHALISNICLESGYFHKGWATPLC